MIDQQQLITSAYAAFNTRNIDAILTLLHPQVRWPRAWEGDYAYGHSEVRNYWESQWKEINPHVTPIEICLRADGKWEVVVKQLVKDLQGTVLIDEKVLHVYTFKDNLLYMMTIERYLK